MQTVTLTDKEAMEFIEWRKYQDKFGLILESGILDIREGSAEIHFDAQGRIGAIKAHVNVYKRDPTSVLMVVGVQSYPHPGVDRVAPSSPGL